MKQEDLLKKLREHQPITVNYGKSIYSKKDIKEEAIWDERKGAYVGDTGIWDTKLLVDIAQGKVEDVRLEE